MPIQRVASKWKKTIILKQREYLRPYIPDTRKYSFEHLQEMIELYSLIYVKPDHGTYGAGVMCAEIWINELEPDSVRQYKLRYGIQSDIYSTIEELHAAISGKIGHRLYLIQKGIYTLTYRRRKFDLRVLVQKTPGQTWETTGFIGRLAARGKIITNHHGGGEIMTIEDLLGPYLLPKEFVELYKEMKLIGVQTAAALSRKYPNLKEIGLDLAIDEQFRPWILEVNTLPALFPFKTLKNKEIYKKIRRYAVSYGRLKA